ncbi:hypothetical protein [Aquimarina sp. AU119]|uniref:hypothetical protein n=1 Tax=Aquimarina sp. AU119 TaxID=2108528 RepID=UPI000D69B305|nr:hypothetical protein [Aquimarina sp. AU119]
MDVRSNKSVRLYRNCDELPIWNFDQLISGKGFEWLVYEYDGYGDREVNEEECNSLFEKIKEEYFEKSENQDSINILMLEAEIDYLTRRYTIVYALLSVLKTGCSEKNKPKFYQELRRWRYYLDEKKPLNVEVKRLDNQHKSSKTLINRKQKELENMVNTGSKSISLFRQKIKLQRTLSMQMDLKKITVTEWLEINKEAEEVMRNSKHGKPYSGD